VLSDGFDLADLPGLVNERRERAVQAKDSEQPLVRNRLDPIAVGLLGPKWMVVEPSGLATAAGVGQGWLPARGERCGVTSMDWVWL
jgi:hypothetical protein